MGLLCTCRSRIDPASHCIQYKGLLPRYGLGACNRIHHRNVGLTYQQITRLVMFTRTALPSLRLSGLAVPCTKEYTISVRRMVQKGHERCRSRDPTLSFGHPHLWLFRKRKRTKRAVQNLVGRFPIVKAQLAQRKGAIAIHDIADKRTAILELLGSSHRRLGNASTAVPSDMRK